MDAEPSTFEPAPKPKFTGPMDKFLSDKRVEAAVNRAVKSITDNPADLERELRDFAQTGENWRQKSMTLEQETEAIRKKLDKVTKELEKVKKAAAREVGNFNDAEDHKAILKAIVGNGNAHDESGRRLLRMLAAASVEKIQATAKGDLLGQMQLAEAVKHVRSHEARGCRQELCAVRADQVWLGLLQEAHERAGFPGLCREHHRARHSTCCVA